MVKPHYPDLDDHKAVHKDFIHQTSQYTDKIKADTRLTAADV